MKTLKLTIEIPGETAASQLLDPTKEAALKDFVKYIRQRWHLPLQLQSVEHTPDEIKILLK
jgi:hypothetical protein